MHQTRIAYSEYLISFWENSGWKDVKQAEVGWQTHNTHLHVLYIYLHTHPFTPTMPTCPCLLPFLSPRFFPSLPWTFLHLVVFHLPINNVPVLPSPASGVVLYVPPSNSSPITLVHSKETKAISLPYTWRREWYLCTSTHNKGTTNPLRWLHCILVGVWRELEHSPSSLWLCAVGRKGSDQLTSWHRLMCGTMWSTSLHLYVRWYVQQVCHILSCNWTAWCA